MTKTENECRCHDRLLQQIGDVDRLVRSESCFFGERGPAALAVSLHLSRLFANLAAPSPLGSHVFRYEARDRLQQDRPGCEGYGQQLMFQLFGNELGRDVGHGRHLNVGWSPENDTILLSSIPTLRWRCSMR